MLFEVQARFEDGFVLATRPAPPPFDPTAVPHYVLWQPDRGTETLLWDGVSGRQDFVVGVSGKWILILRTGYELPFPDWRLLARDGGDGSLIELAHDDPQLRTRPNIPARLPFGLAPTASISGSRVAWAQFVAHDDGTTGKEITIFDLETRERRVVESNLDVTREDVWSAAIAGDRVVWVSHGVEGADRIVLLNLTDSSRHTFDVGGDLYSVNLTEDGSAIVWDDGLTAKYVLYLDSGERLQYLGDEGWGTYRDGSRMSWAPSTDRNGNPGYFHVATRTLHFLEMDDSLSTIVPIGQAMDGWFVWMERDVRNPDLTHATVYFKRLE